MANQIEKSKKRDNPKKLGVVPCPFFGVIGGRIYFLLSLTVPCCCPLSLYYSLSIYYFSYYNFINNSNK
jgi:hypothetical protein